MITARKYAESNTAALTQAQRRGTEVHEICELIDYGADPETLDISPEIIGYINGYIKFLRDYNPEWTMVEQICGGEDFAGRIDRFGTINHRPTIADIKTTSNMDRASKIALAVQLCGYWEALSDAWVDRIGVQLHKNGRYTVIRCDKIEDMYGFSAVDTWKSLKKIWNVVGGYTKNE